MSRAYNTGPDTVGETNPASCSPVEGDGKDTAGSPTRVDETPTTRAMIDSETSKARDEVLSPAGRVAETHGHEMELLAKKLAGLGTGDADSPGAAEDPLMAQVMEELKRLRKEVRKKWGPTPKKGPRDKSNSGVKTGYGKPKKKAMDTSTRPKSKVTKKKKAGKKQLD
ncbi:hypothetical protein DRE_02257 [Drechslerella stenobrocha 248]|uniref:Uncharacterized protein n=1 Tax=Drechslerella stenobrocha 248 TaxID=1043628 RepID=W7I758_9PEZI|nr:hypothetical protein DRE_02257 [Drechslerella stenobrocha 248]